MRGPIAEAWCEGEGWGRVVEGGEGGRNRPGQGPISLWRGFVPGRPPPSPPSQLPRMSQSLKNVFGADHPRGGNPQCQNVRPNPVHLILVPAGPCSQPP